MDLVFGLKWIKSSYCLLYFSELGSKKERFPIKFQIAWHDNYSYLKLVSKSNNHSEAKGRNYCLWLLNTSVCLFVLSQTAERWNIWSSHSAIFLHISKQSPYPLTSAELFFYFLKMGQPRPLFRLFSVFSNKHQYNFYNKSMWKNVNPSSIRRQDSNPRPFEHELSPITARPGLPPNFSTL